MNDSSLNYKEILVYITNILPLKISGGLKGEKGGDVTVWPLVDKVRGMCRRAKHLQQLYAYSQNTLNDTHTYKKGGGEGGGTCECPS